MLHKTCFLLVATACSVSMTTDAMAQGFFDQLGNGIRDEVQSGIRREFNNAFGGKPQRQPPPANQPPINQGYRSLPSEGGNKNVPSPEFSGGGGFAISPGPTQGGGNPVYTPPGNTQPFYPEYQQPVQGHGHGPVYQYSQPTYVNSTPSQSYASVSFCVAIYTQTVAFE